MAENQYDEDSIRSLDWKEHIRLRPGMYIGKLGNGSSAEDGIYILMKEVIDNSIDEFMMGNGRRIDIKLAENIVSVRDFGRGIPLGKVVDVVSKINTGAKYDSNVFQKSVGLNGVGTKAVNALSKKFSVMSVRDGEQKTANFEGGNLKAYTRNLMPAFLQRNGVPYSDQTTIEDYYKVIDAPNGDRWLIITSVVSDPVYLRQNWITSTNFKYEANGDNWDPIDCR